MLEASSSIHTNTNTNTNTNTDTGDGYWRIQLTIKNKTKQSLKIGKYDNTAQTQWSHAGFIVYGDYKPGGPGYMRFKGCFDGEGPVISIPAGGSYTGTFTFYGNKEESDNREARYRELFDNYPFSTLEQRTVNGTVAYKKNNFIYQTDGSSYSGDKDLTGNLTHGNSYTITYDGGPDNAGSN